MKDWEDEILRQMDQEDGYNFPLLNNVYLRGADIRLTAFSSTTEWLVIFEQIAVMENRDFVNVVSAYGNHIDRPGTQAVVRLVEPPAGGDESGLLDLDLWNFTIAIKGQVRHFTPSKEDYKSAGVDVDGDAPPPAKILRLLAAQSPEFFLSDDELLQSCGRTEVGLQKFLQLEDWHHPDVVDDELPSQSPCLRSLAHALAMNDSRLYECPANCFNTHWSLWEEIYREMP